MVSPEEQGATFVELFFDLVFVFAITQVTHYAAHHLDAYGIARSLIVFWLIWWGWTQFTWALNAADTEHHHVRVATLCATATAFAMATAVEKAFSPETSTALWFGVSYLATRAIGLVLYYKVVFGDRAQRGAVAAFATLSILGLAAVLIGSLLPPELRQWVWLFAVAADVMAAVVAGNRSAWGIHAGHFAERHGLILIIALGESLIVAGSALTSEQPMAVMMTGGFALLLTFLLWWTYFGWIQGVLEEKLEETEGAARAILARDAYSLGHFPLIAGVIGVAVGLEAALHPDDYTAAQVAAALGVGLTLFLGSTAWAMRRAMGCILGQRLVLLLFTLGALAWRADSSANELLAIACVSLIVIVHLEERSHRRHYAPRSDIP